MAKDFGVYATCWGGPLDMQKVYIPAGARGMPVAKPDYNAALKQTLSSEVYPTSELPYITGRYILVPLRDSEDRSQLIWRGWEK